MNTARSFFKTVWWTRTPQNRYAKVLQPYPKLTDSIRTSQITDVEILDLIISILDSPYANFLIRQFVLAAITKMSSRPTTSSAQQEKIATLIAGYATNPELEIQQRSVEFANLLALGDLKSGVLERMPAPELKATVMGYGSSEAIKTPLQVLNPAQGTARTNPLDPLKAVTYWEETTS